MKTSGKFVRYARLFSFLSIFAILLSSCAILNQAVPQASPPKGEENGQATTTTEKDRALKVELEFVAQLPTSLESNQSLSLEILDEVTGLALNPTRLTMQPDTSTTYKIKLQFPLGSVIKYRYVREGDVPAYEYNSLGKQVRYRLYMAATPATIKDTLIAWNNLPYSGPYGRIVGRVLDSESGNPVPASLVTAGGLDTLTASDGTFLLDRLPPGIHNLVVYSLDGAHSVFQQEAEVADNSATPADIRVSPSRFVNITFIAQPPEDNLGGIPIRMIGNTYPLGNTFADLRGGISGIASRAPLMKLREDGKYELTLSLPSGFDLRYKYTVGDGFWNAERSRNGGFEIRQLIVPDQPVTIEDTIETWSTRGKGAITFRVTAPANTPPADTVSIQFNPFGWTEPIPMWPLGSNRWLYVLYSPLDVIGEASYRYCRNEQCGIADNIQTKGADATGPIVKPQSEPQVFNDTISEWNWSLPATSEPITVPAGEIPVKQAGFITAVEFAPDYHPSWQPYYSQAYDAVQSASAGWVILAPTWHFTSSNPPIIDSIPGVDPSWFDLSQQISLARQKQLRVAIHPTTAFYQPALTWWSDSLRDSNWWQTWFDRYESFILNNADIAERSGAEILIIGDGNILPALPGGSLDGITGSGVPGNADARWREMIAKVRSHFTGTIGWYFDYPDGMRDIPAFINELDQIYVVLSGPISSEESPDDQALFSGATKIIETDLKSLRDQFDKPLIVGVSYPSAKGAASGCVKSSDACLPKIVFAQGGLDIPAVELDLRTQAQIYNAILQAVSNSQWVSGVVSTGFYPPVRIADQSISVHGKPAADVLWFWYSHFIPVK